MFCMTGWQSVLACSCADSRIGQKEMSQEERLRARLDKATNVVRGRITSVKTDDSTVREGHRFVEAQMNVASDVKGSVPIGAATLITGFGTGDCGIAGFLLVAIARERDVTLEVRNDPKTPGEYWVDMCGYGWLDPAPSQTELKQ
jgi:hypothetical protein